MTTLFKKLHYKGQKEIFILNQPAEFEAEADQMREITTIKTKISANDPVEFALAFVLSKNEADTLATAISKSLKGDGTVWFAYPKGTSKKYKAEINRDKGWEALGKAGFEPVSAVAIDENWSALRFRRVEFIKTMTRNHEMTMTAEGRKKASGNCS